MLLRVVCLILGAVALGSSSYCTGDMQWKADAPICIYTCPQRFLYQECPSRTIGRCVCPDSKPVLKREEGTECVEANTCEAPDWFKLGPEGLKNFKFSSEPQNAVVTAGRSLTLSCVVTSQKPVQYYWYKMDKLPSGDMTSNDNLYLAGTSTITFSAIKVSDDAFYQCKAKSQDGYSLLSRVAVVKVKHTSFEATTKVAEGAVTNKAQATLTCNKASSSYPHANVYWTKDGTKISESDIFMNSKRGDDEFGYLYIVNVKEKHAGTYKCVAIVVDDDVGGTFVLSEVSLTIRGSQNQVAAAPSTMDGASYGDRVKLGETATLFCGGYGYPTPTYSWAKTTSPSNKISSCGEKTCLEDYNRRLVIYHVSSTDYGGYFCQVQNSAGTNTMVLNLEEVPDSYAINFLDISPPHTITPNRYDAFTLTCTVNTVKSDAVYIGWYKDGKSVEIGGRIKTDDVAQSTQLTRFLIFTYPTDSDPGLYQCLAYNSQEFVQASTDVTLATPQTEDLPVGELWEPNSPFELKIFTTKKGIEDAHTACEDWKPNAKLASILDSKQNDEVFRMLQENQIEKAWIGLNDESKEGKWVWLTQEESTRYANWKENEPDNGGGGTDESDYAVMDVASAGRWEDARNSETLPFICKYYNATCPTVEQDDDYKDLSISGYQRSMQGVDIHVFDTAEVICNSGQTVKLETLICNTAGKWQFTRATECQPQEVRAGSHALTPSLVLLLAATFLILR